MSNGTGWRSSLSTAAIMGAIGKVRVTEDAFKTDAEVRQELWYLHRDTGVPVETLRQRFEEYHQSRPYSARQLLRQFCCVVRDRGIEHVSS